ncbi:MAG: S41 family peptidase [Acidobacteriota bacterium]|nr:S41 family peptidase [Acidobacteriota bacterium]
MRRVVSFALIIHLIFAFSIVPAQPRADVSPERNLAVFDEVWETVQERYYDATLRGIDWEARREYFREKSASAQNSTELYRVLRELLASLNDSHTRVFAPDEDTNWVNPRVVTVNVSVREIENQLIVTRVEKNTPAEKTGIRPGDLLTKVDGISANVFFERRLSETRGASTPAINRLQTAARLFEGGVGSTVKICWQRDRAKERCASLLREWRTVKSDVRIKKENGILIVGFDIFTLETVSRVLGALRQHRDDLRGIIMDLRANRGGVTEASVDLASVFLPEKTTIGSFYDRTGRVAQEAQTRQSPLFIVNSEKVTKTPIVILIGTATASAAEIFVAGLKNANRARIIGVQSCGCVLAVRRQHTLPDGGKLEVSELDFRLANGDRLEGVGISPDETLDFTRSDIRAGRDAALEKALQFFQKNNSRAAD